MNYRTLVKGAFALSLSLMVTSVMAEQTSYNDAQAYGATFESAASAVEPLNDYAYVLGSGITNENYRTGTGDNASGWFSGDAESDESKIIERTDAAGGQALQLNTDASTLTNKFSSTVAGAVNTALANEGKAYFETEVKFVPSDTPDAGITGGQDATKFAIYAYANEEADPPTTNLVVFHAYVDLNSATGVNYTNDITDIAIDANVYSKLRVEMKQVDLDGEGTMVNAFCVKIDNGDGTIRTVSTPNAFDEANHSVGTGNWFLTIENIDIDEHNGEISSLNFKGTGEIDNIKAGTIAATTEYAIDWTDSDGVTVTNAEGTVLGAADTNFLAGASIYFTANATPEGNVITNVLVNGSPIDGVMFPVSEYSYTVGEADAIVTVLAGVPTVTPTTYAVSWTVDKVVVSNTTDSAAIVEAVAGSFEAGTKLTFYPEEGTITNLVVNGSPVDPLPEGAYEYTVLAQADQTIVAKAGSEPVGRIKPAWADDADYDKFFAWVDRFNVENYNTDYTAQYLMNVDPSKTPVLKIDSIAVTAEGSQIVVSATDGTDPINLANINGVLNVSVGSTVTALTSKAIPEANVTVASNVATVIIKTADGAFAKATVDFTAAETSLTAVAAQSGE